MGKLSVVSRSVNGNWLYLHQDKGPYEGVERLYLGGETFVERVEQWVSEREAPKVVEVRWAEVRSCVRHLSGSPTTLRFVAADFQDCVR